MTDFHPNLHHPKKTKAQRTSRPVAPSSSPSAPLPPEERDRQAQFALLISTFSTHSG